jgi:hypothetical protein
MLSKPFKSETIADFISKPDAKVLGAGLEIGPLQIGDCGFAF